MEWSNVHFYRCYKKCSNNGITKNINWKAFIISLVKFYSIINWLLTLLLKNSH